MFAVMKPGCSSNNGRSAGERVPSAWLAHEATIPSSLTQLDFQLMGTLQRTILFQSLCPQYVKATAFLLGWWKTTNQNLPARSWGMGRVNVNKNALHCIQRLSSAFTTVYRLIVEHSITQTCSFKSPWQTQMRVLLDFRKLQRYEGSQPRKGYEPSCLLITTWRLTVFTWWPAMVTMWRLTVSK